MTSVVLATNQDVSLRRRRTATLLAFILATAAESWISSGVSLTLTDLSGTLGASSDEASWALTVYTTAYALGLLCAHRLTGLWGNKLYLSAMAAVFAIASIGCASSDSLAPFLVWRTVEGFAGGGFLIRTLVFTGLQYDPPSRPPALISWAISYFAIGRVLAPVVCGWFADYLTWKALFVVGGVMSLVAAAIFVKFTLPSWQTTAEDRFPLDIPGLLALLVGVVCIQIVLSRGEIDAWFESSTIVALLIAGIAANALFAAWEVHDRNRNPLFGFAMIRTRGAFSAAVLG